MPPVPHAIKDPALADDGLNRIDWALTEMPVLRTLIERFGAEKPLDGVRLSACLHITAETANLARVLVAGGADVALCASNPLSTQDDVAAALALKLGISCFAVRGDDHDSYYSRLTAALDHRPQITIDDGADLVSLIHTKRQELLADIMGGTEETTTGVIRLRAMANEGELKYPIIAVNDAATKHLFDNRYGTGQSVMDSIMRATNVLIAGKVLTVCGYGWCGRGVAMRAAGLGAKVIVTEIDPVRAIEACLDGFQVMEMIDAAPQTDFVVTVTGDKNVVDVHHMKALKDGCIISNAGHFDVEINIAALKAMAKSSRKPRTHIDEYILENGKRIRVLGEGRLVNLAAAEGHPPSVMDMSFANQALCAAYIRQNHNALEKTVHTVPQDIDNLVASTKLKSLGVTIDVLTAEQEAYLASWREGT